MQSFQTEVTLSFSPQFVWQSVIKNLQVSLPAIDHNVSSVEFLDGPPLATSGVFRVRFRQDFHHSDYIKFQWDVIDHDALCAKATAIEGWIIDELIQDLSYYYNVLPSFSDPNACRVSFQVEYLEQTDKHDLRSIFKDQVLNFIAAMEACNFKFI
ncbi:hypothetical protein KP509_20G022100 [Ceratopteris richardii]|uniref:Bet v I/Major latex protein domain-containing protein n=1 Tax=Ceratopteris richardii TaxID=49495 RepID=A0A8T2SEE2_CERRI|nr:hypothetical protein KP509_20G022100 [Ceratopteris richardii]